MYILFTHSFYFHTQAQTHTDTHAHAHPLCFCLSINNYSLLAGQGGQGALFIVCFCTKQAVHYILILDVLLLQLEQ